MNVINETYKHNINYKKNPMLYEYSNDCYGMYVCEPYKSVLMSEWKFLKLEEAKISAESIYNIFLSYLKDMDFVGSDMARKYLQAGATKKTVPIDCSEVFAEYYQKVLRSEAYSLLIENFAFRKKAYREKLEKKKNECW